MNQKPLIFSIAFNGYDSVFSKCIKSQESYCEKYGYDFVLIKDVIHTYPGEVASWLKIPLIIGAFEKGRHWVFFIDADCEVRDHTPDIIANLESINTTKTVFMANGKSGRINAGVIFAKNSNDSMNYFNCVLKNYNTRIPEDFQAPYENGSIIFTNHNLDLVEVIDGSLWNNNVIYDPLSFIQHYSNGRMREYFIEKHIDDLELLQDSPTSGFGLFQIFCSRKRKNLRLVQRLADTYYSLL